MKKIFVTILLISVNLISQTVSVFNLQGILRSPTGQAVADGTYSFTFKIYDQAKAGLELGGWVETQNIEVKNGIYNALVGSVKAFTGLAFDKTYFIGISVGGGDELTPRIQLTAAPYALSLQGVGNKVPNDGPMSFSSNIYHKSNNKDRVRFNNDGSNDINGGTNIYSNANALQLIGTNHVYMMFYPNGTTGGKGYFGYSYPSSKDLTLTNEISNGNITLNTAGTGKVVTSSNLDVGGSINVAKAEGSNVMVKVAEVSSADFENSAITISGLDGNKHLRYKVYFEVYFDGGADRLFRINFNNDGGNNYRSEALFRFWGGGVEANSSPNGIVPGRNGWSQNGLVNLEFTIYAQVGKWRTAFGNYGFTADNPVTGDFSGYWRNTSDNITSITFETGAWANKWGAGRISVYAIP